MPNLRASLLYFVVRIRCRRKKFTFAISSADEFLVYLNANNSHYLCLDNTESCFISLCLVFIVIIYTIIIIIINLSSCSLMRVDRGNPTTI